MLVCAQTIPPDELFSRRQQGAPNIIAAGVEILRERITRLTHLLQQGLVTVQVRAEQCHVPAAFLPPRL
jgi:hypothetical protein